MSTDLVIFSLLERHLCDFWSCFNFQRCSSFSGTHNILRAGNRMQLHHHPFDLDRQKARLALEEKGIDYTSYHVNPLTWYIERIAVVSAGAENISFCREVVEWMQKIQEWDSKFFTLSHIPQKYRLHVSKFIRRVLIARMSESPDLPSAYHQKMNEAYETEAKLKDPDVLKRNEDHLVGLLDEVERQLNETPYLAVQELTMADVMLIPVLTRLVLLDLENEFIGSRPNIAEYRVLVQQRPSYKVIGRHQTLINIWFELKISST